MFIDILSWLKIELSSACGCRFVFEPKTSEPWSRRNASMLDKVRDLAHRSDFWPVRPSMRRSFCGPDAEMMGATQQRLLDCGLSEQQVHSERFGVARQGTAVPAEKSVLKEPIAAADQSSVTVIMDGHKKTFVMSRKGASIVDAAAAHGIELPYSCKGGVCATCRTHLREGAVTMANNYGLEPWEVEQGYVLACQSQPQSDKLTLDYDKS